MVIRLFMMLMPSRDRLFWISRVPAPLKSSPGGIPVADDFAPGNTPAVMRATWRGSRPFNGRSAIARVPITSEMLASSVLMAVETASTVTESEMAPTGNVMSVRTVLLISTRMPVLVTF